MTIDDENVERWLAVKQSLFAILGRGSRFMSYRVYADSRWVESHPRTASNQQLPPAGVLQEMARRVNEYERDGCVVHVQVVTEVGVSPFYATCAAGPDEEAILREARRGGPPFPFLALKGGWQ